MNHGPGTRVVSKLPAVGTTIFTVMSRLAEEHGAVNLGQGFPDFDPPAELLDALARHAHGGRNQYAPMAGVPRLREAIARQVERAHGVALDPETELTVTSGATEAIFDAIAAVVRPGDEVVVLDPSYDSYEPSVVLQGGRAVHVPLRLPDFSIDFERLKSAMTERTRLVIVNFPHNPSGAVLTRRDLDALAEAMKDTNALLLSDEVYEHIVFDGREHESVLRHPELVRRSFQVGSFGKSFHATGWKVGWAAAPPPLTSELRKVHQFVTFATSTPAQHALADVLESDPASLSRLSSFYQRKRDLFRELIAQTPFRPFAVSGAYFQLCDYSAVSALADTEFARFLTTEIGVAAIPLSPFYETPPDEKIVRFCFAKTEATLELAAERLRRLG
ncbi:MAG TPA: methionine aminotransferase [Polyangiaceae bacterium]|nr:methionine aminotransferase [Polyangiaceae bacterium]